MKKTILLAFLGIAIGLGGGTGWVVMSAQPGADDQQPGYAEMLLPTEMVASDAAFVPPLPTAETMEPVGGGHEGSSETASPEGPSEHGARLLASIVAEMEPRSAAAVLGELNTAEVDAILQSVAPDKVARILSAMDPATAAVLGRILLASEGS